VAQLGIFSDEDQINFISSSSLTKLSLKTCVSEITSNINSQISDKKFSRFSIGSATDEASDA
jgi:hypothetical protein